LGQAERRARETIDRLLQAVKPLSNPTLRTLILTLKQQKELLIDTVTQDCVLEAGFSEAARERAQGIVHGFEAFIDTHRDEITALQILYNRPTKAPLTLDDLQALADTLQARRTCGPKASSGRPTPHWMPARSGARLAAAS